IGKGMYWSACISTWPSSSFSPRLFGIWITLVIAASPEMAMAASRLFAPDRLADRFRVDDGLLVDGIVGRGLGRVGLHAVLSPRHGELDELHGRGRYVKPQQRTISFAERQHRFFPYRLNT